MGSPVLEYLKLIGCRGVKGIQSRSLRELVVDSTVVESPLEISTPRLLSLRVKVDFFYEIMRINEAPSLVEAELDFDSPAKSDCCLLKDMLCKLQNASQIVFGAWCLRVMLPLKVKDVLFSLPNCKCMTVHIPFRQFSFPAVANMLATTPNLEKLVIIFEPSDWSSLWYESDLDSRNVDHESYSHIEKKFKHWAQQLKNVEIFGFYGCLRLKYEEVLMLVKFLFEHAFMLENIVIKGENRNSQEDHDLEVVDSCKLLEVTRRLQKCHRTSRHARKRVWKAQKKGVRVTAKCLSISRENA
ncbi:uncharacterized protein LOC115661834 [Syzygium oleosum]|uniref:uncharacterized protein LOC115661834 n=1 Tax=Syzygium oleosum TaxID=219896 RepID=UPI0024B8C0FC|nr:uncharacterized protein LOC115661834 [Syzygium oleosum]